MVRIDHDIDFSLLLSIQLASIDAFPGGIFLVFVECIGKKVSQKMSDLRRNTIWNVLEVAVTAITMFLVYKLIVARLDVSSLGVWSLVLSTTSIGRIADLGIAAGLSRYIARAKTGTGAPALLYVETALSANLILYIVLGGLIYWPASHALAWAVHGNSLLRARDLLPYAVASFVSINLASVVTTSLIGFHRSDLKSMLILSALFVQLVVSWTLIKFDGLIGLAIAQICQNAVIIVIGWVLVLRVDGTTKGISIPHRLNIPIFKEILGFGLQLQAMGIASLLYEPATKFVLSAIAGPGALGLYEIAYRIILQARAVIIIPSQNLTPIFASMSVGDKKGRELLYQFATAAVAIVSILGISIVVFISPLASMVLLKHRDNTFILTVGILCAGWFFNVVCSPAYFMGIANGKMRGNIIGVAASSVISPLLGYALGEHFGYLGVAIASAFAIAVGGIIILTLNCRDAEFDHFLPPLNAYIRVLANARKNIRRALVAKPVGS